MARRSLRPQLNQIRTWVRQGRTDAWIAHQLEVSPRDITAFKREHDLAQDEAEGEDAGGGPVADGWDMRAEDDALVAAELDAMDEDEDEDSDEDDVSERSAADDDGEGESPDGEPKRRRRGRRGGRRRRGGGRRGPIEGTFDHGEEGYGLWLDPSVQDDAVYAEHWAGHRSVTVTVEPDQIVIRRTGDDASQDGDESESGSDDSDE